MVDPGAEIEAEIADRRQRTFFAAGQRNAEIDPGGQIAAVELGLAQARAGIAAGDGVVGIAQLHRGGDFASRKPQRPADQRRQAGDRIGRGVGAVETGAGERRQRPSDCQRACCGCIDQRAGIGSAVNQRLAFGVISIGCNIQLPGAERLVHHRPALHGQRITEAFQWVAQTAQFRRAAGRCQQHGVEPRQRQGAILAHRRVQAQASRSGRAAEAGRPGGIRAVIGAAGDQCPVEARVGIADHRRDIAR